MKRRVMVILAMGVLAGLFLLPAGVQADPRTEAHQQYATTLWEAVTEPGKSYTQWRQTGDDLGLPGPADSESVKTFLSSSAARNPGGMPYRSVVVTEHLDNEGHTLAVTVRFKGEDGYDARNGDWYWAHFLPDGTVLKTSADKSPYCKPGFVTVEDDGRVWVFPAVSKDVAEFFEKGEPGKCVIRPGVGPMAVTLKSSDMSTIENYVAARPGFFTKVTDGRIWVAKAGTDEADQLAAGEEWAKRIIRPGAGPMGMTVNGPDNETVDQYLLGKPGFVTFLIDGRLWVFAEGDEQIADVEAGNEPAKHVIRPGAGPGGITLKSSDNETIAAYLAAQEGFDTFIADGRIWVFPRGCPDVKTFEKDGEPAKFVTRPGAGPAGMTVRAPDSEVIDAYLRVALAPQP